MIFLKPLRLLLLASYLIFFACFTNWHQAYSMLKRISPNYIVLSLFLITLQCIILATRWQHIGRLQAINISSVDYSVATLISFFFSQGLPSSIGSDVFRVWWLTTKDISKTTALTLVTLDRLSGFVSLAALSMIGLSVIFRNSYPILITVICTTIFSASLLLFAYRSRIIHFIKRICSHAPAPEVVRSSLQAKRLYNHIRHYYANSDKYDRLRIFALSCIPHLLTVCIVYLIASSLNVTITLFQCFAVVLPAQLIGYLPISLAGWGVREASFVIMFSLIGIPPTTSILLSLILGLLVLVVSLLGGILWLSTGLNKLFPQITVLSYATQSRK